MTPIRVLVVDDHALSRRGLAKLLASESDFEVVGEAVDGHEGLEMARELTPDVILMDLSMPGMDGLETTRRITAELPHARIVILTADGERDFLEAIESGASGCFLKTSEPQALYGTLRDVAQGLAARPPATHR